MQISPASCLHTGRSALQLGPKGLWVVFNLILFKAVVLKLLQFFEDP